MRGRPVAAVALVIAIVLTACIPVVRQVDPAAPQGLTLALEVTNRSGDEVEVGYEFQAGASGGVGNGSAAACRRTAIPFGPVSGTFQVIVDGDVIAEADVPAANLREGYVVVPIEIAPVGSASVGPMRVAPKLNEPAQAAIPECP